MKEGDEVESKLMVRNASVSSTSELDKPIRDIIKLIFDIENMKRQMLEFEVKI